jgi:acyl-[acyl-carrier-protein] desaturase
MVDAELLHEIEPQLEQAFDEHMSSIASKVSGEPDRRPFNPVEHIANIAGTSADPLEYFPVIRADFQSHVNNLEADFGVDIKNLIGAVWTINLLTEDNLPHYTSKILGKSALSPALVEFAHEWTAEEDAHGVIMRDFALGTGVIGSEEQAIINHQTYHAGRVQQLRTGTDINPTNLQNAFAYLSLQEDLTREAHYKSGWLLGAMGKSIMGPVTGDEQNHYEFYRKALEASLAVDPDETLVELNQVYKHFDMPGKDGIPNFKRLAETVKWSGIFDYETVAKSMQKIINKVGVRQTEPKTYSGKSAQEALLAIASDDFVTNMRDAAETERDLRVPEYTDTGLLPFILGRTIEFDTISTAVGPKIRGLKNISG